MQCVQRAQGNALQVADEFPGPGEVLVLEEDAQKAQAQILVEGVQDIGFVFPRQRAGPATGAPAGSGIPLSRAG